ncbi:DUF4089 domain-containing protein [Argonema galeatum]|uniref:DUF4089 domain-containing protein n=1 Tax=Argonema galeatum TaxID=2942762 RepID=UPI0020115B83|nr:DUF4089 domain-containing protein [Argonema galeatum]MCL1468498.1 DUF4089 domain-containing protein [Argonema galeatum A003/A1]
MTNHQSPITNHQIAEYVDLMAKLIDLPLDPEHRNGVIANMTIIAEIAQLVNEFTLPDEIEAATVFQP